MKKPPVWNCGSSPGGMRANGPELESFEHYLQQLHLVVNGAQEFLAAILIAASVATSGRLLLHHLVLHRFPHNRLAIAAVARCVEDEMASAGFGVADG